MSCQAPGAMLPDQSRRTSWRGTTYLSNITHTFSKLYHRALRVGRTGIVQKEIWGRGRGRISPSMAAPVPWTGIMLIANLTGNLNRQVSDARPTGLSLLLIQVYCTPCSYTNGLIRRHGICSIRCSAVYGPAFSFSTLLRTEYSHRKSRPWWRSMQARDQHHRTVTRARHEDPPKAYLTGHFSSLGALQGCQTRREQFPKHCNRGRAVAIE